MSTEAPKRSKKHKYPDQLRNVETIIICTIVVTCYGESE